MKTIGTLLTRSTIVICIVVLAFGMPASSAAASPNAAFAAFTNDSFTCEVASRWADQTGSNANPTIVNAGTANASLQLAVAVGVQSTMSSSARNASRVLQPATDESFELEVRFTSPLPVTGDDNDYRMQGVLIRDNTGAQPKWLRFDLNQDGDSLGYYMSYINESGTATGMTPGSGNIAIISQNVAHFGVADTRIRIRYTQSTGEWAFRHYHPALGWSSFVTFTESAPPRGSAFSFTVTDIGLWVGSTGSNPPGHTAQFDYIYAVEPPVEDDVIGLCDFNPTDFIYLPLISR